MVIGQIAYNRIYGEFSHGHGPKWGPLLIRLIGYMVNLGWTKPWTIYPICSALWSISVQGVSSARAPGLG